MFEDDNDEASFDYMHSAVALAPCYGMYVMECIMSALLT